MRVRVCLDPCWPPLQNKLVVLHVPPLLCSPFRLIMWLVCRRRAKLYDMWRMSHVLASWSAMHALNHPAVGFCILVIQSSDRAVRLRRVCACMQTQVKVQMDERDSHNQPPPNPLQPPGQQMMGQSAYAGPPQVKNFTALLFCMRACLANKFFPGALIQSTVVSELVTLSPTSST